MDYKLFFWLFNLAQKNRCLGNIAIIATKASSKIFFIIYIAVLISLALQRDTENFILCVWIPFLALCVTLFLRKIIHRPRPYQTFDIEIQVGRKEKFSFPSNHSASASIIAITCLYCYFPLGIFMCALALFTGISRILTGVHYPSDVLAGFVLSSIIGLLYLL